MAGASAATVNNHPNLGRVVDALRTLLHEEKAGTIFDAAPKSDEALFREEEQEVSPLATVPTKDWIPIGVGQSRLTDGAHFFGGPFN